MSEKIQDIMDRLKQENYTLDEVQMFDSALKLQELVKERIKNIKPLEEKDTVYAGHYRLTKYILPYLESLLEEAKKC